MTDRILITFAGEPAAGDTLSFGERVLTFGQELPLGGDAHATAGDLMCAAINGLGTPFDAGIASIDPPAILVTWPGEGTVTSSSPLITVSDPPRPAEPAAGESSEDPPQEPKPKATAKPKASKSKAEKFKAAVDKAFGSGTAAAETSDVAMVMQTSKLYGIDGKSVTRGRVALTTPTRADQLVEQGKARRATEEEVAQAEAGRFGIVELG